MNTSEVIYTIRIVMALRYIGVETKMMYETCKTISERVRDE